MDMEYNYIIPPWDSRHGKLGHIWKKYHYEVIMKYYSSLCYFIPPELVINDYEDSRGNLITSDTTKLKSDKDLNWVSSYGFNNKLWITCRLTQQEYFDLIVLHINDKSNRPRCSSCKSYLSYTGRVTKGYGGGGYWIDKINIFCSRSCLGYYTGTHLEEYPKVKSKIENWYKSGWIKAHIVGPEAMHSYYYSAKNKLSKFINLGNPDDQCYLYITHDGNSIKYGVTCDVNVRQSFGLSFYGSVYKWIHVIQINTRLQIGYMESIISLYFQNGEYISYDSLSEFFKLIKSFKNKVIDNPFI